MPPIQFTRNHSDHSTDLGFQFEFFCDRCGNGFMSQFRHNKLGAAGEIARGLGSVFGGVFGRAASGSYEVDRLTRGKAHDDAMVAAVTEIKPLFNQCQRCGTWVCKNVCWNNEIGMCVNCAPKREGEIEAAKSDAFVQQIRQKASATDFVSDVNIQKPQVVTCPNCGNSTGGAKFCPNCGYTLVQQKIFCTECGNEVQPGARFCGNCGKAQG
jgi:hypothetical protein